MKHTTLFIIITLFSLTAMAQDRKVAVMEPAGSVPNAIRDIVREEISTVVVNALGYTVLERSLIDKVLEENKFQSGGLVDDSQISEMGKRMGANLVLVSSLTIMENGSYYISCKMIDVLTARIEKQKTARTQQKSNDLIDVVEKMVSEMFVYMPKSSESAPTAAPQSSSRTLSKPQVDPKPKPILNANNGVSSYTGCGFEIMSQDLFTEKTNWQPDICPEGWRLPTRPELQCMCREKTKIERLQTGWFSNYFTSESDQKEKIGRLPNFTNEFGVYVRSFDDCEESRENLKKEKGWVRCVR